jgi:hypothetical protein
MGLTYNFASSDTGAPTINNTAGGLITLLDACLVNGYNSKTVTITRSGSTATASCTSHGFRNGQILKHTGAGQTEYNIEARITYIDANSYSYQVTGTPATPATGTITAIVAPLGWTKPYTGTNLAAFRQKAGTNQFYLRVDDSSATDTYLRGYEVMTAISTGTGDFPTAALLAGGSTVYKSSNATNRPWKLWSDGKLFHLLIASGATAWTDSAQGSAFSFGDFISYKAGDAYNTLLMASTSTSSTGSGCYWQSVSNSVGSTCYGCYVARNAAGTGAAYLCPKTNGAFMSVSNYIGSTSFTTNYPDPVHGGMNLSPVFIGNEPTTGSYGIRGYIQGLWGWMHLNSWAQGDTFTGANGTELAGRTFEQASPYTNAYIVLETSDTWGGLSG